MEVFFNFVFDFSIILFFLCYFILYNMKVFFFIIFFLVVVFVFEIFVFERWVYVGIFCKFNGVVFFFCVVKVFFSVFVGYKISVVIVNVKLLIDLFIFVIFCCRED